MVKKLKKSPRKTKSNTKSLFLFFRLGFSWTSVMTVTEVATPTLIKSKTTSNKIQPLILKGTPVYECVYLKYSIIYNAHIFIGLLKG